MHERQVRVQQFMQTEPASRVGLVRALNPMIREMSFAELSAEYGTNEARVNLLAELEVFLKTLDENFSVYRLLVYGSFLAAKENPSDIDVMAHVCACPSDAGFSNITILRRVAPPHIDVFTLSLSKSYEEGRSPPTAHSMVESFNNLDSHLSNGTACHSAVELTRSRLATSGP